METIVGIIIIAAMGARAAHAVIWHHRIHELFEKDRR